MPEKAGEFNVTAAQFGDVARESGDEPH